MAFQVSVIVPVYNAERYVRRAVESAVHLSEVGEIILVDDAGPDNSFAVCQVLEQQFSKVKLIHHQDKKNHGAGASRNLGILYAQCEYISFLDADDFYLPNRFKKDCEILLSDPSIDGVYSAIGIHYESEGARRQFLDAGYHYQEFLTLTGFVPPEELIEVLFHSHMTVKGEFHTNAVTVRKKLFEKTGLFNEKLRLRQDIHLWRKMAAVGRLAAGVIDAPVAIRGVHGQNRMIRQDEQLKYIDYWWRDLAQWFHGSNDVIKKNKAVFNIAYAIYRIQNRNLFGAIRALIELIFNKPLIIIEPMGLFDLSVIKIFKRSWLSLHVLSFKNKLIRRLRAVKSA